MILGTSPPGLDIAQSLTAAAISVTLIETDPHAAERAAFFLGRMHVSSSSDPAPKIVSDIANMRLADLVFVALDDFQSEQAAALNAVARHLPDSACIALTDLQELSTCDVPVDLSTRLFGFQIFAPVPLRQLVEIAPGPNTRPEWINAAFDLARAMGKTPVAAPARRLSVGTRLLRRLYDTADTMLMDGANPFELDDAMIAFGFDIGLYAAQDLIGLDVAYADRKRCAAKRDPARRYIPISDRMVEEGRLGKKVGVGWYRYPGGGGAVIDPLVEDLIREEAWFADTPTRSFATEDIQNRLALAMVHEAALMLADGTAASVADINVVSVCGLGFPTEFGGVLGWADAKGAVWINAALNHLAHEDTLWAPGQVISDCAERQTQFSDWRP